MQHLVIPVTLEERFAQSSGSTEGGFLVTRALQLNEAEVTNVYSTTSKQFKFSFQERGVAYDETEATDFKVEVSMPIPDTQPSNVTMRVDPTPVEMWGLNFAARVIVIHTGSNERIIYIPGTRTYDPAGLTGDKDNTALHVLEWQYIYNYVLEVGTVFTQPKAKNLV